MKYQVGDLVRVKELVEWENYGGIDATPGMAKLSGSLGIVNTADDDYTVQIIFEISKSMFNDYWFSVDMIEPANLE